MNITKYIKLFGLFKDISSAYKEETGNDRPFYLSRGFWSAVAIFLAAVLKTAFGYVLDDTTVNTIVDNAVTVSASVSTIVPAIVALYGVVMGVAKAVKGKKADG